MPPPSPTPRSLPIPCAASPTNPRDPIAGVACRQPHAGSDPCVPRSRRPRFAARLPDLAARVPPLRASPLRVPAAPPSAATMCARQSRCARVPPPHAHVRRPSLRAPASAPKIHRSATPQSGARRRAGQRGVGDRGTDGEGAAERRDEHPAPALLRREREAEGREGTLGERWGGVGGGEELGRRAHKAGHIKSNPVGERDQMIGKMHLI
ncbi:hypothetical protein PVAP13_1NG324019 [Panicum virgatum]|uniref:Uncharacterized protein n=1 Tax=Panicum virgatum TaxID=38727 RepID=A0A8T0WZ99_PANVG|nr:hypothetical protein PVAP13_1NG324019 [Panicum virgatum]